VFALSSRRPAKATWLSADEKRTLSLTLAAEHRGRSRAAHVGNGRKKPSQRTRLADPLSSLRSLFLSRQHARHGRRLDTADREELQTDASNRNRRLMAAIPQICTIVAMIWWGRRSDRKQERKWHLLLPMLFSAAGWLCTALLGKARGFKCWVFAWPSAGSYTAMSIFWTTPDHALSFRARAIGIAVINATGNIGSALNPLVVGWLKDLTHSFSGRVAVCGCTARDCARMLYCRSSRRASAD